MIDYVDANTYASIAHYRVNPDYEGHRIKWNPDITRQNSVVFVKKGLIRWFFHHTKNSPFKHILITHLDDDPIDFTEFSKKPFSVVKWYAENACYNHPDLIPIPFGLDPHYGVCACHNAQQKFDSFMNNIETCKSIPKATDVVYCNWDVSNNPAERANVVEKLNVKYIWEGDSGKHKLSYEDHLKRSASFKFIISPPGNGVDAVRQWQTIYSNCVPIVLDHNIYKECDDLPMIRVKKWEDVTEDLLQSYLELEKTKKFNYEILTNTYWKNRIMGEYNKL